MKRHLGYRDINDRSELLAASDSEIEAAIRDADPMCLRGLMYQLTGDEEIAATKTAKKPMPSGFVFVLASSDDVILVRRKAFEFLKSYRDRGAPRIDPGPASRLARSLSLTVGQDIEAKELEFWTEELAIDPWVRGLNWTSKPSPEKLNGFKVAILGAGLSGLGAMVYLRKAGIPCFAIEKNADVGGTWLINKYPGVRVDTPSRSYTHLFGVDYLFDHPFSPGNDNYSYCQWAADHFELRKDIHFSTEVTSAKWNDETKLWDITANGPEGVVTMSSNVLITGTGIHSLPNIPDIPGMEEFKGKMFHTANWPESLELSDKRVAVIGSAATGYQLVCDLLNKVKHVTMFQRKPQWVFPAPGYLTQSPEGQLWLDRNFPYHVNFMRLTTAWRITFGANERSRNDPNWTHPHSRSPLNHEIREGRIAYIREKLAARPDLAERMIPPHPPGTSRPLIMDQDYNIYDAVLRDNLELVSSGVEGISAEGPVAAGKTYPVDVIIWATGFHSNDFLMPVTIIGRDGENLHETWSKVDGPRAYVAGTMMPGFPNMFMLLGPNSGPGQGGNVMSAMEISINLAMKCIERMILDGKKSAEISRDAYAAYNAFLDAEEKKRIYTDKRSGSYFTNEHNRSVIMSPISQADMQNIAREEGLSNVVFG